MGCKMRLLSQIIPYFPKDIECFYDLFGGSGIVSMNVEAKRYVINDYSWFVYDLYKMLKEVPFEAIIARCRELSDKYGFVNAGDGELNRKTNLESFYKLRDSVNESYNSIDAFLMIYYSFFRSFKLDLNGKFTSTGGGNVFKKSDEVNVKLGCDFFSKENVSIFNKSFSDFSGFKPGDFVYLDPPYFNTNANYNAVWTMDNEMELFAFCERLNDSGVKFAMSDVFKNKGISNEHLMRWCDENGWTVHHLDINYSITSQRKSNDKLGVDEVLICNYDKKTARLF